MKIDQEKYEELLKKLGKRPATVLQKILENGSVSTYELGELGYDQPPRAAQDLKESGVVLKTSFGKHPITNSRMAIYSLGAEKPLDKGSAKGRNAIPKKFRQEILENFSNKCNICNAEFPPNLLQIDHRIPFIIAGEVTEFESDLFQPLCGSHQRLKSWSCEHCENREHLSIENCQSCYWAYPDIDYNHIAMVPEKRIDITWSGDEQIDLYNKFKKFADSKNMSNLECLNFLINSNDQNK